MKMKINYLIPNESKLKRTDFGPSLVEPLNLNERNEQKVAIFAKHKD